MADPNWFKNKAAQLVADRAKTHPVEITLPLGCSAEPDTCGSCKFFARYMEMQYYTDIGYCEIVLPPSKQRFKLMTYEETGEQDWPPNKIKDTARCDLYRPDGRVYIVQRRVPEEKTP